VISIFLAGEEAFNREFMLVVVNECLKLILAISYPMLMAAIISGVAVACFQAMTQVQEQTLSFVPKIVATFYAVLKYGPWIATEIVSFATKVLGMIATIGPPPPL
jgi:flagellar biosynthesis protein FliQ